jgi:F0F1-type ATP synthase delta subunit
MDGKIYTAYSLDPDTLKGIADKFTERMGSAVTLKQEVDSSLIAGFIVQIGFLRFDYSARARLKEMMRHMLGEA